MRESCWTVTAKEWERARARVARLAVEEHRRIFGALLDHMQAGWEIVRALQVEAEHVRRSQRHPPQTAQDVASFLACEPVDDFRYVVELSAAMIPGGSRDWIDALGRDMEGEAYEIVRDLHLLYLAAAHPDFPPLLGAMLQDAYPRMAEWLARLPELERPILRLAQREERGQPVPVL
jgi:hypothetical protein